MERVFPTCVGMNRCVRQGVDHGKGVPHVCGDEPGILYPARTARGCSPRVWG